MTTACASGRCTYPSTRSTLRPQSASSGRSSTIPKHGASCDSTCGCTWTCATARGSSRSPRVRRPDADSLFLAGQVQAEHVTVEEPVDPSPQRIARGFVRKYRESANLYGVVNDVGDFDRSVRSIHPRLGLRS